jgi:hypothetical protein
MLRRLHGICDGMAAVLRIDPVGEKLPRLWLRYGALPDCAA